MLGSNPRNPTPKGPIMATFDELLAATGLPDAALAPLREKYNEALSLITRNNEQIAQVNASKAQDPTKPGYSDYLDALWAAHAPKDEKMAEVESNYQKLVSEAEKLLTQLRDFAKSKVKPPLSEDDAKKVKAAINEATPAIQSARVEFAAMATMVDSYLTTLGKGVEGGLVSLLPEADSLRNPRGRKAATGEKSYMTRLCFAELNGKNIHRDGKTNFRYLADSVSTAFGADKFAENKVSGEELEEAFFKAIGKEFRSVKSTEIPTRTEFDFTKEIKSGENTTETKTVKIAVGRKEDETSSDEKPAEAKSESKPEAPKVENAETEKVSEPAKKTAAAPAKK
jgi:ElaB/YqjD/DUF883 family membrane-anchored ribosome-binding protein